jgi:hypothetical protein
MNWKQNIENLASVGFSGCGLVHDLGNKIMSLAVYRKMFKMEQMNVRVW